MTNIIINLSKKFLNYLLFFLSLNNFNYSANLSSSNTVKVKNFFKQLLTGSILSQLVLTGQNIEPIANTNNTLLSQPFALQSYSLQNNTYINENYTNFQQKNNISLNNTNGYFKDDINLNFTHNWAMEKENNQKINEINDDNFHSAETEQKLNDSNNNGEELSSVDKQNSFYSIVDETEQKLNDSNNNGEELSSVDKQDSFYSIVDETEQELNDSNNNGKELSSVDKQDSFHSIVDGTEQELNDSNNNGEELSSVDNFLDNKKESNNQNNNQSINPLNPMHLKDLFNISLLNTSIINSSYYDFLPNKPLIYDEQQDQWKEKLTSIGIKENFEKKQEKIQSNIIQSHILIDPQNQNVNQYFTPTKEFQENKLILIDKIQQLIDKENEEKITLTNKNNSYYESQGTKEIFQVSELQSNNSFNDDVNHNPTIENKEIKQEIIDENIQQNFINSKESEEKKINQYNQQINNDIVKASSNSLEEEQSLISYINNENYIPEVKSKNISDALKNDSNIDNLKIENESLNFDTQNNEQMIIENIEKEIVHENNEIIENIEKEIVHENNEIIENIEKEIVHENIEQKPVDPNELKEKNINFDEQNNNNFIKNEQFYQKNNTDKNLFLIHGIVGIFSSIFIGLTSYINVIITIYQSFSTVFNVYQGVKQLKTIFSNSSIVDQTKNTFNVLTHPFYKNSNNNLIFFTIIQESFNNTFELGRFLLKDFINY